MGNTLHREGRFDDRTRQVWRQGYQGWTQDFGREEFPSRVGMVRLEINTEQEFEELARRNSEALKRTVTVRELKDYIDFLQNTVNYRYWRTRSLAESQTDTAVAHREIFEGQRLFKDGKLEQSEAQIRSGLTKLESLFRNFPRFEEDDLAVEEVLLAMLYLRAIYNLNAQPVPEDLPLQRIWNANTENMRMGELMMQFRRETGFQPPGDAPL
jgi:hypothetical protein